MSERKLAAPASLGVLIVQALVVSALAIAVGSHALGGVKPLDFQIFWAAQHLAHPYDADALTRLMASPRPTVFPYPPTFLLLTLPLKFAALKPAYFAWLALSASAFVTCVRREIAPAMVIAPAVFIACVIGQTTLFVGAALYLAATMTRRPVLSGVLLGLVACIKPQVGVLIPFVLLAARQWRVMASASGTVIVLCAATTLVFGLHVWGDWLDSLPAYLAGQEAQFAVRSLAISAPWSWLVLAVGAGLAAVAGHFGRLRLGFLIALAGGLLGSVHAMDYDAAVLAPLLLTSALPWRWRFSPAYLALMVLPPSSLVVAGAAVVACADLLSAAGTWTRPAYSRPGSVPGRS